MLAGRALWLGPHDAPSFHAEAVHVAVERAEVGAAVGNGQSTEVVPRGDLRAAGPEFLAGLSVQGDQLGAPRSWNAAFRTAREAAAHRARARLVPRGVLDGLGRILTG